MRRAINRNLMSLILTIMTLVSMICVIGLYWTGNTCTTYETNLEVIAQYYANYSRTDLYDIKKWNALYHQYLNDFGEDSAYTKNAYDQYNQAKAREENNLWYIDGQINNLISARQVSNEQAIWLKERVRELRTP